MRGRSSSRSLAARLQSPSAAAAKPWLAYATARSPLPVPAATDGPIIALRVSGGTLAEKRAAEKTSAEQAFPAKTLAEKLARVEAILFLTREPVSSRKLATLADLADGTEARSLVRELARRLRRRGSAFQPVEVAHGIQLLTRPQLADWLRKVHPPAGDLRLSAPALETLAVTAYRQPVTRADIESIRGVQCGEILRVLMERDFLRIVGRSEELGRPFLYGTTRKFLQVFGLRRLEQLPPVDQICNAATSRAESLELRGASE